MNNRLAPAALLFLATTLCDARDFYVNPDTGANTNAGSLHQPLASVEQINALDLQAGDNVFLAKGHRFEGSLVLKNLNGKQSAPIRVASYLAPGDTDPTPPLVLAQGHPNGILLENCSHILVENLQITASGPSFPNDLPRDRRMRCGVLVINELPGEYKNITLRNLTIEDVFFHEQGFHRGKDEVRTANGTQAYGWGIRIISRTPESKIDGLVIDSCLIRNVSHTGIKLTGHDKNIRNVSIKNNTVHETGGPGIQMSNVALVHAHGNEVDKSGSKDDSRKWGRGSGLWTWGGDDILIERNQFRNANGPGDSAGCHIDYNCRNVIVQYNLSQNNAGGFCEVLGNNYNCAYRYNISINDGHRIKGENGAFQEGKIYWLSGYVGNKVPRSGPFNTYFYNNTIYVPKGNTAKIAVGRTASGVLIANNIFCFEGESAAVKGDQYNPEKNSQQNIQNVVFKNNLYRSPDNWPQEVAIQDSAPIFGNPTFRNPLSSRPSDFTPQKEDITKDRGIQITNIPGDDTGLALGLKLEADFLGNPITGLPDLGAIELQ